MILRNWATTVIRERSNLLFLENRAPTGFEKRGASKTVTLSVHLWLRFGALWFAVVLIGFIEGYVLLPLVSQPSLAPFFSP
jgi:predicted Co/Zn/Cd cation transporter (cation efflux family)